MTACSYHLADKVMASHAEGVARRYMATGSRDPGYQADLCLHGLLCLYEATRDTTYFNYIKETLRLRGERPCASLNWRILFTDLHGDLWMHTRDTIYMEHWLDDLHELLAKTPLDDEGHIVFFIEPERQRLLIDLLQGYALRMARAGLLTGDASYFDRVADQYHRHAKTLIHPENGLWHHGRGWNPDAPTALAPEGWCRGQAWVLRGLVEAMLCIPPTRPAFHELHHLLRHLASTLLRHQGGDGMWHQIVQEPERSFPETSGTGMILYYLGRAGQMGWLDAQILQPALRRALVALCRFVDIDYNVHQGCPHCPPQTTLADYRRMAPTINDRHAVAGVMMALSLAVSEHAQRDIPAMTFDAHHGDHRAENR